MRLRPFFPYYGAKWSLAKSYPRPRFGRVVELFAGSACYSLLHHSLEVILVEKNPIVRSVWQYLLTASQDDILSLPDRVLDTREIDAPQPAKWLIGFWLGRAKAHPSRTLSKWGREWASKKPGAFWGPYVKRMIASQLRHVRHWRLFAGDALEFPTHDPATWFVDPPYSGNGGRYYPTRDVDYTRLAEWCRQLPGQVIVCEAEGADWLPFVALERTKALTLRSGRGRTSSEVVWLRGSDGESLFDHHPSEVAR